MIEFIGVIVNGFDTAAGRTFEPDLLMLGPDPLDSDMHDHDVLTLSSIWHVRPG